MELKVLFFATLKDRTGVHQAVIHLPEGSNVSQLKQALALQYPVIKPHMSSVLVSVNREFAFDEDKIADGAEVALFPPVSGGGWPTICRVTYDAVNTDELVKEITLPSTGAACIFNGIVRGETHRGEAHTTLSLEYEAYIPMAEAKMQQIAREMREKWLEIEGIALVQRIGLLTAGTPTVWVACSAAHRDTGVFEAAHYGIDRLKEIVPVWKKEIGEDGVSWVEGDYIPGAGD